jgi:DNA repair exonuclease SbcCD nuclease subunit
MMYNLFSDPHLGTKRAAHTTAESAQRLKDWLHTNAMIASEPMNTLCLGDLFDRAYNDETTLLQGYNVAHRCQVLLSGNHDETNRQGAVTSLHALKEMGAPVVSCPDLSTPHFETWHPFWMVPHHASQDVFEKALEAAAEDAKLHQGHRYLLLHCNYDCPFDTEDSTLNLSPEMAGRLLNSFTRIFMGHEHNSKILLNDRLVIVGNTHPTSFSDISDKFRWKLDTDADDLTPVLIWQQSYAHRELTYGEPVPDLSGVQFVDVIGAQPVENGVEVAEYVRSVWNAGNTLIAVRNHVEIIDHLANDGIDTSSPALVNLSQRINDDLAGSDLQGYYQALVKRVEQLA